MFPSKGQQASRRLPDCAEIHKELAKSGVTLSLLWNEYCESCRLAGEIPLMYTQFCNHYRRFAVVTKATMHIDRKPGEQMEVDWAGQTASLVDRDTGEISPAHIFVAALSSSQYAYVEATLSQDLESWIQAHVHAFSYFGGVARILVPDNLKTGVASVDWYTPVINRTYHEMAEHYGTAVIPARIKKPKDKPTVEGTVGIISTWIVAALRNGTYFSLQELNDAVKEKLTIFNEKPFQKRPGSRMSTFAEEEAPALLPLPVTAFELAIWKTAIVQYNYHVAVEKMYYSVPYEYIHHEVDVRITHNVIEVFFHNHRLCSHPRLHGRLGQYSTETQHMPDAHKQFVQWNAERFISWAQSIGTNTEAVIQAILASHKVEQQGYRACIALLKLAESTSKQRLESACQKALTYTPSPSYKTVMTILKAGKDKPVEKTASPPAGNTASSEHGFTRGADYYGRES